MRIKKAKQLKENEVYELSRDGWVTFRCVASRKEVLDYVGEKCDEFEKGCPVCEEWALWEKTGKVDMLVDAGVLQAWVASGGDLRYHNT